MFPTGGGTPVVIDTDVALEGIMSVLYLVDQDDLAIRAITVSGTGLVHCDAGVAQILGLLDMVEAPEIPVACGPEEPLEGINAFPASWRASADAAYGLELPTSRSASELDAPELLARAIAESPEPVLVYADGPQTNLASAIQLDPSIVDNIERAYIMGGAIDVAGNTIRNGDAEWNIWVDPTAASEVLSSGIPITLVPLDATNQVPLHVFHLRALEAHQDAPAARAVATMLRQNDQLESGGLYFWDQLTAALLVDETYGTTSNRGIDVVLGDDRSVAGSTVEAVGGSTIDVVESVDRERFETDFLSVLAGIELDPIVVDPDWTVSFDGVTWSSDVPAALEAGEYVVRLTNSAEGDAGVAFGWLIDDATAEDMDAWEGISQPPFYELESFTFAPPGFDSIVGVTLTSSHEYLLVGLDVVDEEATRIAFVEVDG
jgi:pyrimidine-specific ribonucleoside hydrolase